MTDLALSAIYRAALLGGLVFTVIQPSPLPRLEREIVGRDTTPRFNVRRWRSHGMQFNVVPRTPDAGIRVKPAKVDFGWNLTFKFI